MHTAKGMSKFLSVHGIFIVSSAEQSEGQDAIVNLERNLFVQICDYPVRDGGLTYILNRYVLNDKGELVGSDELLTTDDRFELLKRILVELA